MATAQRRQSRWFRPQILAHRTCVCTATPHTRRTGPLTPHVVVAMAARLAAATLARPCSAPGLSTPRTRCLRCCLHTPPSTTAGAGSARLPLPPPHLVCIPDSGRKAVGLGEVKGHDRHALQLLRLDDAVGGRHLQRLLGLLHAACARTHRKAKLQQLPVCRRACGRAPRGRARMTARAACVHARVCGANCGTCMHAGG